MSFATQWKTAKKLFETATGKKKPGPKLLGAIRLGTGVDSAAEGLDKALEKSAEPELNKAEQTFQAAQTKYISVLKKAAADDKGAELEQELDALAEALEDIAKDFGEAKQKAKSAAVGSTKELEAQKRKVAVLGDAAQKVLLRLKDEKMALQKVLTETDSLLVALLDAKNRGDTKALKAGVANVKAQVKRGEEIAKRAATYHDMATSSKSKTMAEVKAFEAKNKVVVISRPDLDKTLNPLFDQMEIVIEEFNAALAKLHAAEEKASAAEKAGLDANEIFAEKLKNYVTRVRDVRKELYAIVAEVTGFADKANFDYLNLKDQEAAKRTEGQDKLRSDIVRRAYHTKTGPVFLARLPKILGPLYADQVLTDPRVQAVPGAKDDIQGAQDYLTEMDRYPKQIEGAITTLKTVLAKLEA